MENDKSLDIISLPDINTLKKDISTAMEHFPITQSGNFLEDNDTAESLIQRIIEKDPNYMSLRLFINNFPLRFIDNAYSTGDYSNKKYQTDLNEAKQNAINKYWKDKTKSFDDELKTCQEKGLNYTWPIFLVAFDAYITMRKAGYSHYTPSGICLIR